jgi:hypothetical protein
MRLFPKHHTLRITCALLVAFVPGCGARTVAGGTPGVLHYRGDLVSDIRVTVHRVDGSSMQPIGFGITAADGTFELVTNGARGALRLSPGEYCCTLKSVGAQVRIPNEYAQVNSTPLKVAWSVGDTSLDLQVRVPSTK